MTNLRCSSEGCRWRFALGAAGLAASPALLLAVGEWESIGRFIARFHTVVLHFPISLLLLAGLLETVEMASRGRWRFPVALILFLGAGSAVATMALGLLLARTGAIEGALVDRHMLGGIAVAALAVVTLAIRLAPGFADRPGPRRLFRVMLLATCGALTYTAHHGGSITHGEGYLNEYAPWREPISFHFDFPEDQPVAQWDVYAHVVTPILQARCYECHRSENAKGRLVLDQWEGLQRGGKSGLAVSISDPDDSLLLARMELPLEHKEHMPPRRKPQPTPEERALLRRWISAGAPGEGALSEIGFNNRLLAVVHQLPVLLDSQGDDSAEDHPSEIDPAAVAKARAKAAETVAALQARYPHILNYESRQSADLELRGSLLGRSFGDNDLAALARLRDHLVWADLSGTAVTDRSAPLLAEWSRLRVLRLARTEVTDAMVAALERLKRLESLNLFDTPVTNPAHAVLHRLPGLRRLYLAETAAPEDEPGSAR